MAVELLTEKYFPKNFDEFIGNVEIVDFVKKWAIAWNEGKKDKPVFLFGSPGVGKTALAYLIAKEFNWQLFEMNASDLRNKDEIEKVAGAAMSNASLFGGKRLILIDEIDSLQAQDRGGAGAIAAIIKETNNPVILTANEIYSDKKLLPFRSITHLKEFKKINYLSIAKRLREICEQEGIEFDVEAIKELAKSSGGDFRGALLDLQSMSPTVLANDVKNIFLRQRKEKIFSVMTKIFNSKSISEIQETVFNSEVSNEMLTRWVEENIPRQFDGKDSAKAFHYLSRSDVFMGRIFLRQHYSFLKYVTFLSTVGVGLSREKDYSGWKPFQFPSLLSSLSASTSKRQAMKTVALKAAKKMHCSSSQVIQDIYFLKTIFENKLTAPSAVLFFGFDEKDLAFLLNTKKDSKKVEKMLLEASALEKSILLAKSKNKQSKIFFG